MLDAEIDVSQKRNLLSIWVYFKNGEEEWSPVYFDWGKHWSEEDVFGSIRSEVHHSCQHKNTILQSA